MTTSRTPELAVSDALEGWCTECGDTTFEQPPCTEGHGEDCPELVCAGCGMAYFAGSAPEAASRETADQQGPAQAA
ncbi:MAG TPA: hypothetical protein VGK55_12875 [Actinomycetes bacterium]